MPANDADQISQPANVQRSSIIEDLLILAPHTEIIHHIPGRIRLRLRMSGLEVITRIDVESLMHSIPGIQKLRVNPVVGSLTLEYDQNRLPFSLWEKLGGLRDRPEMKDQLVELLNRLWEK